MKLSTVDVPSGSMMVVEMVGIFMVAGTPSATSALVPLRNIGVGLQAMDVDSLYENTSEQFEHC